MTSIYTCLIYLTRLTRITHLTLLNPVTHLRTRRRWSALCGFTAVLLCSQLQAAEVRSMPLTNTVGSECPTTGVRVEAVTPQADVTREEIVLSVPKQRVDEQANLKLYKLDNTAFAFAEFKELRDNRYGDRRTFSVVVAKSETLRFKVGFDSSQY